jgi:hypothetical protein
VLSKQLHCNIVWLFFDNSENQNLDIVL